MLLPSIFKTFFPFPLMSLFFVWLADLTLRTSQHTQQLCPHNDQNRTLTLRPLISTAYLGSAFCYGNHWCSSSDFVTIFNNCIGHEKHEILSVIWLRSLLVGVGVTEKGNTIIYIISSNSTERVDRRFELWAIHFAILGLGLYYVWYREMLFFFLIWYSFWQQF